MLIHAHRGASGHAPENTLPAFELSLPTADGVECDIHLTSDGEFVVCHDPTIDRTSNGRGEIRLMTLKDLKKYDFGRWYAPEFAGTSIPTLDEMIRIVKKMRLINIEIKSFGDDKDAYRRLVSLLKKRGVFGKTIISSFDQDALISMTSADSKIKTALLYSSYKHGIIERALEIGCKAIHPQYTGLTKEHMQKASELGLEVNTWTANNETSIKKSLDLGCTGVITNYPELARKIV